MKMLWIITGIVLLLIVVIIGVLPKFTSITNLNRETHVVQTLRTVHNSQAQFRALKGRFGTLKELADMGLIGEVISSGNSVVGYIYSDANVSAETYCVRAKRANDKVGTRDFNIIQDGEVRYHEAKTGSAVACGEGISLTSDSK